MTTEKGPLEKWLRGPHPDEMLPYRLITFLGDNLEAKTEDGAYCLACGYVFKRGVTGHWSDVLNHMLEVIEGRGGYSLDEHIIYAQANRTEGHAVHLR